ncbi:hypothetical protein [Psychrobacter immobilis]|uniref:hypothetical protein n=1 Tax=Psychrobacter immobilis TaxID=498 RepID=UPI001918075A|nr:hypothetical protein [Psychrobacter immobilis]
MNYDKNLFYTLDEVRDLLLKTGDRKFSRDENIANLIHTDRLTPYIRYSGPVDIVIEAESASEESINQVVNSLYHTINTQMCNLEIGEAIHPYDYDSNMSLGNTKYFIGKLLFLLNAKRALKNLGITILADGIFRLLPSSITYLGGNIEVALGPKMFIPKIIDVDFKDDDLNDNEIKDILGYTLCSTTRDNYEIIFLKNDLQYIITVIESSHELPKLRNDLSDANRTISELRKQNKDLTNKLQQTSKNSSSKNDKNQDQKIIAMMAIILAEKHSNLKYGYQPNKQAIERKIKEYIDALNIDHSHLHGLESPHKRIATCLKEFSQYFDTGVKN